MLNNCKNRKDLGDNKLAELFFLDKGKQMYNGYKNYPTWVVNLWLSNEQSSYNYWTDRAKEIFETAKRVVPRKDVHRRAIRILADELEGCHESCIPEVTGVYCDLLAWALNQVDWFEVAEQFLAEE